MSERTAQCQECTDTFEAGPRGPLPKVCPKCKKDAAERPSGPPKPRKNGKRRSVVDVDSPAIAAALDALREEIDALEIQIEHRRDAIKALEAVA